MEERKIAVVEYAPFTKEDKREIAESEANNQTSSFTNQATNEQVCISFVLSSSSSSHVRYCASIPPSLHHLLSSSSYPLLLVI